MQSFTDEHEHLKEATPEYAALLRAMVAWMEKGNKPTVQSLAAECDVAQKTYGEACHFAPGFYPKPLGDARLRPHKAGASSPVTITDRGPNSDKELEREKTVQACAVRSIFSARA